MHFSIGSAFINLSDLWPNVRDICISKSLSMQYADDDMEVSGGAYTIFAVDPPIVYYTTIFRGTVPVVSDMSQSQNDTYKSDFETNYRARCNMPIEQQGTFNDPRMIRVLGNLTTGSTAEVLVTPRRYTEPGSEAQRSVVSTNTNDSNPSGTGAKQVRIVFLNSSYIEKTEDIFLNGTTPVNTVAADIRFIQDFKVIKGANPVGAIRLMSSTGGGGTEICGIPAASNEAFLSHYYVPSGSYAFVRSWGATVDDDASVKLTGQQWVSGNLTDQIIDLQKIAGPNGAITVPGMAEFSREVRGVRLDPKTYLRITCVPSQSTNTTVRAFMEIWTTIGPAT